MVRPVFFAEGNNGAGLNVIDMVEQQQFNAVTIPLEQTKVNTIIIDGRTDRKTLKVINRLSGWFINRRITATGDFAFIAFTTSGCDKKQSCKEDKVKFMH